MRLLLDTHAFIWWFAGNGRLSATAQQAMADGDNDILFSAVSAWEITTKYRARRLPEAEGLAEDIIDHITSEGFEELPITVADAARAGALPGPLRDPFDRMLIAQAQSRGLTIISIESLFDRYGVRRLW